MIEKGQIKKIGPISIIIPNNKGYMDPDTGWKHLEDNGGMTFSESVKNCYYNYIGWKIPNLKECKYIYSFIELGVLKLKTSLYWLNEESQSMRHEKFYLDLANSNSGLIFKKMHGGNKILSLYIKINW